MKYFIWTFDRQTNNSWFLGEPRTMTGQVIDAWHFERCQFFESDIQRLEVPIRQTGRKAAASFGAFDLLYVNQKIAKAIMQIVGNDVQLIPISISSQIKEYSILNALREINCIDEKRSSFTKWEEGNMSRPDKIGQYRSFTQLFVDPEKIIDCHIFRPWGWRIRLIVSEHLKKEIEILGCDGTIFIPV